MIRIQKELAAQVGKPKREMPLLTVQPGNSSRSPIRWRAIASKARFYSRRKVDAQQSGQRA